MNGWGPGTGSHEQRPVVEEEEETTDTVSEAEEGDGDGSVAETVQLENTAEDSVTHVGTQEDEDIPPNIQRGEYAFLPVFAFSASHCLVRQYVEENDLEHVDSLCNPMPEEAHTIDGKIFSWWNDNSLTPRHPFLLINPMDFKALDVESHDLREIYNYERGDQFVYSDSGGYQIMSMESAELVNAQNHDPKNHKVNPERLMDWEIRNADAGASLDFPPYQITTKSSELDAVQFTEEWIDHFHDRKELSADMAGRMAARLNQRRQEGSKMAENFIFAPVIQGKSHPKTDYELMHSWHQSVRDACEAEGVTPRGWTLSPKPALNIGQLAGFLGFTAEYLDDADFIHALMIGGTMRKTLLMYFAMKTDFFVTSDASSHNIGSRFRKMFLPGTAIKKRMFIPTEGRGSEEMFFKSKEEAANSKFDIDLDDLERVESVSEQREENARWKVEHNPHGDVLDRFPCRCRVCESIRREYGIEFITHGDTSAHSSVLDLHNLTQMIQVDAEVDAMLRNQSGQIVETDGSPSGNDFWRYMNIHGKEKRLDDLYRAMDFVRVSIDHGIDEAYRRYTIKWVQSNGECLIRGSSPATQSVDNW